MKQGAGVIRRKVKEDIARPRPSPRPALKKSVTVSVSVSGKTIGGEA